MIEVEQVIIDVLIPSDEVCIVAMQPFVRLRTPAAEPFQWEDGAVDAQLDAVRRTLDVAEHGVAGRSAVFTLFPEYAIPGVAGASIIDARVFGEPWPKDSIVIAGIDGLGKPQYRDLYSTLAAQVADTNSPDSVPDDQWVNCCVMWVKNHSGDVRRWIQPKIRPNWDEHAMFRGSSVFVFEGHYEPGGYPYRFITLVCSDWVAKVHGSTVRDELLKKLDELWVKSKPDLDWVFVIQNNSKPNHPSFLNGTLEFLTDRSHPFVRRDDAIVLHVNTAVSPLPARSGAGGFTACILSPRAPVMCTGSPPTVCTQPASLRGSDALQTCKDGVFREMGECIHVFTVRVPRSLGGVAADKTFAVPTAHVHPTKDMDDPRLCEGPVHAAVKWINDSLDRMESMSTTVLEDSPIKGDAEGVEAGVAEDLRRSDGHRTFNWVDWATCAFSRGNQIRAAGTASDPDLWNPDLWEKPELCAVEHLLHSLTCMGVAYNLVVAGASLHGSILTDVGYVQVVAIRGDTHTDCLQHYRDNVASRQRTDPVLVLVRDHENLPIILEQLSTIIEPDGEVGVKLLDYNTLTTRCRHAADATALKGDLDAFLPGNRRII